MKRQSAVLLGFLIIALLVGMVRFVADNIVFSLLLQVSGSVILPFIYIVAFIPRDGHLTGNDKALRGVLVGVVGNTSFGVIGALQYYFLGGDAKASLALGRPVTPLTVDSVIRGLTIIFLLWLFWLVVTTVVSYGSAWITNRN